MFGMMIQVTYNVSGQSDHAKCVFAIIIIRVILNTVPSFTLRSPQTQKIKIYYINILFYPSQLSI